MGVNSTVSVGLDHPVNASVVDNKRDTWWATCHDGGGEWTEERMEGQTEKFCDTL